MTGSCPIPSCFVLVRETIDRECGVPVSEWERVAEDAGTGEPTGEDADEFDGVDVDTLAVGAVAEFPAGRALQHELERLAVNRRPLRDDVRDEAAVMVGGQVHVAAGRHADVDAVGPHVAGEADVEEVPQGRAWARASPSDP